MEVRVYVDVLQYDLTFWCFVRFCCFQRWLTDIEIFATIIAALIHDYEHTGTTNNFHIMTGWDPLINVIKKLFSLRCAIQWTYRESSSSTVNNIFHKPLWSETWSSILGVKESIIFITWYSVCGHLLL